MKNWSICLLLIALGGCASAYIAPARDAPTASISFKAKGNSALGFAAYLAKRESPAEHSCMIKSQMMARVVEGNPILRSDNPENILIESSAEIGFRTSLIPANIFGQVGCSYDVNLKPDQGGKYRIVIEWVAGKCHLDVESETNGIWGLVSDKAKIEKINC